MQASFAAGVGMGVGKRFALGLAIVLTLALPAAAHAGVAPNSVGQIDCNGFSPIQTEIRATADCADPRGLKGGRLYDNGYYIGHDEPSVRFLSNAPGSSADITYVERFPVDPAQLPTVKHPGLLRLPTASAATARFSAGDDLPSFWQGRLATVHACTVIAGQAD
jgi:hypothetical protein